MAPSPWTPRLVLSAGLIVVALAVGSGGPGGASAGASDTGLWRDVQLPPAVRRHVVAPDGDDGVFVVTGLAHGMSYVTLPSTLRVDVLPRLPPSLTSSFFSRVDVAFNGRVGIPPGVPVPMSQLGITPGVHRVVMTAVHSGGDAVTTATLVFAVVDPSRMSEASVPEWALPPFTPSAVPSESLLEQLHRVGVSPHTDDGSSTATVAIPTAALCRLSMCRLPVMVNVHALSDVKAHVQSSVVVTMGSVAVEVVLHRGKGHGWLTVPWSPTLVATTVQLAVPASDVLLASRPVSYHCVQHHMLTAHVHPGTTTTTIIKRLPGDVPAGATLHIPGGSTAVWFVPSTVSVHPGASLIIDAGATLFMAPGAGIGCAANASVQLRGSPTSPVAVLPADDTPPSSSSSSLSLGWAGITAAGHGCKVVTRHALLVGQGSTRYDVVDASQVEHRPETAAIRLLAGSSAELEHTGILDGPGQGVAAQHARLSIRHCLVSNMVAGGEWQHSDARMDRSVFVGFPHVDHHHHHHPFQDADNDALYVYGGSTLITRSTLSHAMDDCLDSGTGNGGTLVVVGSTLSSCFHEGVALSNNGASPKRALVSDSVVANNQQGVEMGFSLPTFWAWVTDTTFEANHVAVRYSDGYGWPTAGVLDVSRCRFVANSRDVLNLHRQTLAPIPARLRLSRCVLSAPSPSLVDVAATDTGNGSVSPFSGSENVVVDDAARVDTSGHDDPAVGRVVETAGAGADVSPTTPSVVDWSENGGDDIAAHVHRVFDSLGPSVRLCVDPSTGAPATDDDPACASGLVWFHNEPASWAVSRHSGVVNHTIAAATLAALSPPSYGDDSDYLSDSDAEDDLPPYRRGRPPLSPPATPPTPLTTASWQAPLAPEWHVIVVWSGTPVTTLQDIIAFVRSQPAITVHRVAAVASANDLQTMLWDSVPYAPPHATEWGFSHPSEALWSSHVHTPGPRVHAPSAVASAVRVSSAFDEAWFQAFYGPSYYTIYHQSVTPAGDTVATPVLMKDHKGAGPFTALLVQDRSPVHGNRPDKGVVNLRMIELKEAVRRWLPNKFQVHVSQTAAEGVRDAEFLFGRGATTTTTTTTAAAAPDSLTLELLYHGLLLGAGLPVTGTPFRFVHALATMYRPEFKRGVHRAPTDLSGLHDRLDDMLLRADLTHNRPLPTVARLDGREHVSHHRASLTESEDAMIVSMFSLRASTIVLDMPEDMVWLRMTVPLSYILTSCRLIRNVGWAEELTPQPTCSTPQAVGSAWNASAGVTFHYGLYPPGSPHLPNWSATIQEDYDRVNGMAPVYWQLPREFVAQGTGIHGYPTLMDGLHRAVAFGVALEEQRKGKTRVMGAPADDVCARDLLDPQCTATLILGVSSAYACRFFPDYNKLGTPTPWQRCPPQHCPQYLVD